MTERGGGYSLVNQSLMNQPVGEKGGNENDYELGQRSLQWKLCLRLINKLTQRQLKRAIPVNISMQILLK